MRLSVPDSRSTFWGALPLILGGCPTLPLPRPNDSGLWGGLFHSMFSTTAPDYDRSQWLNEKFKLGLDFPNVGAGGGGPGDKREGCLLHLLSQLRGFRICCLLLASLLPGSCPACPPCSMFQLIYPLLSGLISAYHEPGTGNALVQGRGCWGPVADPPALLP